MVQKERDAYQTLLEENENKLLDARLRGIEINVNRWKHVNRCSLPVPDLYKKTPIGMRTDDKTYGKKLT